MPDAQANQSESYMKGTFSLVTAHVIIKAKNDKYRCSFLFNFKKKKKKKKGLTLALPLSGINQHMTDNIILYYFSQKTDFDVSCKLSPDNLHEMSKPVF